MKTYKEMTASVLARGKVKRKELKRKMAIGWVTACACCMALVILGVLVFQKTESSKYAGQLATQPKAEIMMLNSEMDHNPKGLIKEVSEPYRCLIRVTETEGMSSEDVKTLMEQERVYAESLWSPDGAARAFTCYGGETALISIVSSGRLMLRVDDYRYIKDFTVTTTENGYVGEYGHRFDGEFQGVVFGWTLSDTAINRIEVEPTVKLSSFSDTITICVEFRDGTTETVVADVMINDDGEVYIVHRGAGVSA